MVTYPEPRSSRPHMQVMKTKYSQPHVNMRTAPSHTVVTTGCMHRSTPRPRVTPTLESTWQSQKQQSHTLSQQHAPNTHWGLPTVVHTKHLCQS